MAKPRVTREAVQDLKRLLCQMSDDEFMEMIEDSLLRSRKTQFALVRCPKMGPSGPRFSYLLKVD